MFDWLKKRDAIAFRQRQHVEESRNIVGESKGAGEEKCENSDLEEERKVWDVVYELHEGWKEEWEAIEFYGCGKVEKSLYTELKEGWMDKLERITRRGE